MASRRGRRHHSAQAPLGTLFASADAMVAVRLAKMTIAESQRSLRDKAIYRPHTPLINEGCGGCPSPSSWPADRCAACRAKRPAY